MSTETKYGTKYRNSSYHMGGIAGALTAGKVRKVTTGNVQTGLTLLNQQDGSCGGVILPREELLPPEITPLAAEGLVTHETLGHGLYTDGRFALKGVDQAILNALEDPRVERITKRDFPGTVAEIDELNRVGVQTVIRASRDFSPVHTATMAVCLEAYGEDLDLLRHAPGFSLAKELVRRTRDLITKAVAAETTRAVAMIAKEIGQVLRDLAKEAPQPPAPRPRPDSRGPKGESSDSPESGEGQSPEGDEGEDSTSGESSPCSDEPKDGSDGKVGFSPAPEAGKDNGAAGPEAEPGESAADDADRDLDGDDPGHPSDSSIAGSSRQDQDGGDEGDTLAADEDWRDGLPQEALEALEQQVESAKPGDLLNLSDKVMDLMKPAMEKAMEERRELLKQESRTSLEPDAPGRNYESPLSPCGTAYAALVAAALPMVGGIRSSLRLKLLAESRTRVRTGQDEGVLCSRDLHKLAAGTSSNVFQRSIKGQSRKINITLLVDCSGSMGCGIGGDSRLCRIDLAQYTATALVEAFRGLPGLSVEVLGFDTAGSRPQHFIAKTFKQRDASGISGLFAGGGNADSEALRWAARRTLAGPRADRRIVMVLSDGIPTDMSIERRAKVKALHGISDEGQDLRDAVEACTRADIEVIALGMAFNGVRAFYPRSVVVMDQASLAGTALQELAKLLALR